MYFPSVVKESKIKNTDQWIELEKIKDYPDWVKPDSDRQKLSLACGYSRKQENSLEGRDRRSGKVETRWQIVLKRKLNVYGGSLSREWNRRGLKVAYLPLRICEKHICGNLVY